MEIKCRRAYSTLEKPFWPREWSTTIKVPIGEKGCTLECYESLMELPVGPKIDHCQLCVCQEADAILLHDYLGKLYQDEAEASGFNADKLRTFQVLIHNLCDDFDELIEGGFAAPVNVPDPRGTEDDDRDDKVASSDGGKSSRT